jgi:hypothetical protein
MKEKKKEPPEKKKKERFEITELFMARNVSSGWKDCFYGVIYREKDESGKEIGVYGKIDMKGEGAIWSRDISQDAYGGNLDSIVQLRLDYGLHKDPGVSSVVADQRFFHN